MSGNIETHVIEHFLALYGEPQHADPEAFMGEYVQALHGTPTVVLILAMKRVVEAHGKSKIWPGIEACRNAIREITTGERKAAAPPAPVAKPITASLDGKSIEELLAEHRARMDEVAAANKASRRNVTLPSVNRDAWEARNARNAKLRAA